MAHASWFPAWPPQCPSANQILSPARMVSRGSLKRRASSQAISQHHPERTPCLATGPRIHFCLSAPPEASPTPPRFGPCCSGCCSCHRQVGSICSFLCQFPGSGPLYYIPEAFLFPKAPVHAFKFPQKCPCPAKLLCRVKPGPEFPLPSPSIQCHCGCSHSTFQVADGEENHMMGHCTLASSQQLTSCRVAKGGKH